MKLIIAGSRTIQVAPFEMQAILAHHKLYPTEIVSGAAVGVDRCGEKYAKEAGVQVKLFPADWDLHGKSAGHRRNAQMAEYGDALLLIWDGTSRGSSNMKLNMEYLKKPIFEVIIPAATESTPKSSKVEYVKSQGQTRHHHCHWPDCNKNVPPAMWGCKEHWFKLPIKLRNRIWATYKPGQEINMTPSKAYLLVADEVQEWIRSNK